MSRLFVHWRHIDGGSDTDIIAQNGNSSGVIIPEPILEEIGARAGDSMDIAVQGDTIVLSPAGKRNPREGWAEAAAALAAAGEDELVWPEFGNIDDEKLTW